MWTVPRQRAKNGQPNRVPLSPLAVRLIKEAQELGGGGAWLFPSPAFPGRAGFAIIGEYYDGANSDADPEPAGLRRHSGAHPASARGCPSPADA